MRSFSNILMIERIFWINKNIILLSMYTYLYTCITIYEAFNI